MIARLFAYSLAVSIMLIPLYLTVKWVMGGLTFHRLTRLMLTGSIVASLLLPFAAGMIDGLLVHGGSGVTAEAGLPQIGGIAAGPVESGSSWIRIAVWIYAAGLMVFAAREMAGLVSLASIIRSATRWGRWGRWIVVVNEGPERLSPFSFGRYIVVDAADLPGLERTVMVHESAHLDHHHWIDLMLADVATVLCWYCPASWLMRNELSTVHEYEADEAVLLSGAAASDYQKMLIKKAAGSRFPSIACNLTYHSNISKRIKMMLKQKSHPSLRMAAAAALPVMAAGLMMLASPAVANALNAVSEVKVTNNYSSAQEAGSPEVAKDKVYEAVEVPPVFPGGEAGLMMWVAQNLRYPVEAVEKNIQGRVVLSLVVKPDCTVEDVKVIKGADPMLDAEAIRVVKQLKFDKPGYQGGKAVSVWYTVPVTFRLQAPKAKESATAADKK